MTTPRKKRPRFRPTSAKVAILRTIQAGKAVPGPARSAVRRLKVEGLVRFAKLAKAWTLTARGTTALGRSTDVPPAS